MLCALLDKPWSQVSFLPFPLSYVRSFLSLMGENGSRARGFVVTKSPVRPLQRPLKKKTLPVSAANVCNCCSKLDKRVRRCDENTCEHNADARSLDWYGIFTLFFSHHASDGDSVIPASCTTDYQSTEICVMHDR